ncbi:MAG: hypothetical protein R6W78_16740 [Bacteroidales bacterium]
MIFFKRKIVLRLILAVIVPGLLLIIFSSIFIEPWIRNKIVKTLNHENRKFTVEIDKVHILIALPGIALEGITIQSKPQHDAPGNLKGKITSIQLKGIKLSKILFGNVFYIKNVIISNVSVYSKLPLSPEKSTPIVSAFNIQVKNMYFDKINLIIENNLNSQAYSLKDGFLTIYDLKIDKKDTLLPGVVEKIDFKAKTFSSVSADSMYSYSANGIYYASGSNRLEVNRLSIQPNYKDYDFTSRYRFQTDRFEGVFENLLALGFNIHDYLAKGSLISSSIEIMNADIKVFRDNRREKSHAVKRVFQDMIYDYSDAIQIDSIGIGNGNIIYTEHAEDANDPGFISFNEMNVKIYNVTNNIIYKTDTIFLEIKGNALLMGKGRLYVLLKAQVFDSQNTFTLNGTLSEMEADELNPILGKIAFMYITSGTIEAIDFNFTADNTNANGHLTLLYNGLKIAVKNKRTDNTTAIKERMVSFIVNQKVMNSNPLPGKEVRTGIINYDRDPEKFIFNYVVKSILTGINSSLQKNQK